MTRVSAAALADALARPTPTPEQVAVIEAPLEPMLVIAGAGSGKTETIASRVVYLVANGMVAPEQVLGLTFSRKAAAELGERIRTRLHALAHAGIVPDDLAGRIVDAQPTISTYHSFAGRLIDEFGPLAGIEPPSRILTETASWQLAREVVTGWDRDLETDHGPDAVTRDVLSLYGALSDHLSDVDALAARLDEVHRALAAAPPSKSQRKPIHTKLAPVLTSLANRRAFLPLVRAYGDAKQAARAVDFADQMQWAATLVRSSSRVREVMRSRHAVVLLDEYQDTGHAQRVILRGLFGVPTGDEPGHEPRHEPRSIAPGHCVTAVGDPVQSIYGWRGASASNLPRFTTDFPRSNGDDAPTLPLLVSFRNARRVLDVANNVSEAARHDPVPVGELRARPDADDGDVTAAMLSTVDDENTWIADYYAALWAANRQQRPTMAVLVRRRAAMAGVAAALRGRGVPVEIVGVGGLIDEPEVADVVAMLRMIVDHGSGPAAMRILTGARWRLGIADIVALARRARELRVDGGAVGFRGPDADGDGLARVRAALTDALEGEDVDEAGLVDALADPGDEQRYSGEGYRRVCALGAELRRLRSRLPAPLMDTVIDIQRTIGLEVEVLLAESGRAHLEAFGAVVADLAASGAGPVELLDYLAAAADREDGLAPAALEPAHDRVQVLTVHAAKGLEWDIVAVPQLCAGVFPNDERASTWLTDSRHLPPALRGDRAELPVFALSPGLDQGELAALIEDHKAQWKRRQSMEERRLFYVAVTRARHRLFLSAHRWAGENKRPRREGEFLRELVADASSPLAEPDQWAPEPPGGETNPLTEHPLTGRWPIDPLGARRDAVAAGAAAVRAARDQPVAEAPADPPSDSPTEPPTDPDGWSHDVDLLLAERAARSRDQSVIDVPLPRSLSVSELVEMAADPQRLARAIRRPIPRPPAPQARRGTRFHAWLQQRFEAQTLLDLAELPGAHDMDALPDDELPALIEAFEASPWAARTPIAVEVPFVTQVAGQTVRGRIDAVFAEPDGTAVVVDWKTGAVPGRERARAAAIQLTAYRLAWSRMRGLALDDVRAAFYYVPAAKTVTPEQLLDARGLDELILASTTPANGAPLGERPAQRPAWHDTRQTDVAGSGA